jgi:alpha-glucosidase
MIRAKLACFLALSCVCSHSAILELSSPNGKIGLQLSADRSAQLVYSVTESGRLRFGPARAGVTIDGVDLGAEVTLSAARTGAVSEVFAWRGNKTQGTNRCHTAEIPVRHQSGLDWTLEARVFDDGVAFRYRVPGTGKRHVNGEATRWQLPQDAMVWHQTNTGDYEGEYHATRADAVRPSEEVEGKKRAVYLGPPATIVFADGSFGLITEAALYDYSGMTLRPEGEGKFAAAFQDDPNGWDHEGEILSPWRVILVTGSLNGLVNSDVVAALCEPPNSKFFPEGMNTSWIKPGKAPCTWMVFGNDGAQWDKQKWFVDISAATGCEYLLVDAGWRTERWGWMKDGGDVWARAAELCKYAAERNVGIVLWHAYPEGRDDGPGLTTIEAREELFRRCRDAGVKGVKIDFFNSESKAVIDAYEDLLERSANYQLMINFHGANKPTGEARTWPNEITREGIREQEYVLWSSLPLAHYGALPFTRMVVGHADFLPGYIQPRFLKNTTAGFQMASVIVFSSPFLCWPDNPEAYLDSPVLQFVRTVPVTWDETRILPGSVIGETVLMARRKGDAWYLAGLNCRDQGRDLTLDLSFLKLSDERMTVHSDSGEKGGIRVESRVALPKDGKLTLPTPAGGGFVVRIETPKKFAGWGE